MNSKIEKTAPQASSEPKPKARKIPERGIVAALMPGAPVRDFDGYRMAFSIVPLPFPQLTAAIVSSSAQGEKLLTRATGDRFLRGKKVGGSDRAVQNRTNGLKWPGAVWSGSNMDRSVRPGVCHGASSILETLAPVIYGS